MFTSWIALIVTACLLAILYFIYVLIREIRSQQQRGPQRPASSGTSAGRPRFFRQPSSPSPGTQQLQRRLVALLNGDNEAANRLLRCTSDRNPGKPATWLYEKTIHDLERDRGRH